MAVKMTITRIHAREILDSRGNPTIETEVTVETETTGKKSTKRPADAQRVWRQCLPEPAPENLKPLN